MFETILSNNFDEGSKIIAGLKKVVKTRERLDSATAAEADRKAREAFANGDSNAGDEGGSDGAEQDGNQISNAQKIQKLVDAEMKSMCHDRAALSPAAHNSMRNKAWANVKRQFPKLFNPSDYSKHDQSRDGADDPTES
jgi:hypothetical protein